MPLLQVDSYLIQRSRSDSSVLSIQSTKCYGNALSAFSNSMEYALNFYKNYLEVIVKLRCEQARNIAVIKTEVHGMTGPFPCNFFLDGGTRGP